METAVQAQTGARERILTSSYDLFLARGVRAVGVNEIIAAAGVAKASFYSHFPSKDDLVLAFFERRESVFTVGYLTAESQRRADTPRDQLMAIFEIFDEWFHTPGFTGCPYIRALLENGPGQPLGAASLAYIEETRTNVRDAATLMGLTDPDDFAYCWLVILQGAIVSGVGIDPDSAARIRTLGEMLISLHTPAL
ncbi:TetR/AcrR family transcriptional regulator [Arthrobacter cheniae]|uniref:TetR/AcrR family transcriptional regulator n=1 Tax=Arthrobacter cheniae TaxID=1258888 RepID=A0A3A5LZ45_9MICC|nr:TetR/AcrR family transcriptional regulator [Arthrobacter cheniae]RJT77956.1 TetR/AcrR family transcriptional regulator [Arthrobacter cheniae]